MHKKIVVFVLSVVGNCSFFWGEEKETMFYGKPPAQVVFDLKKMQEAPIQVKHLNYRLLYGASGNGVRMTARLYSNEQGGIFEEHPFADLVHNYKQNGAMSVKNLFTNAVQKAQSGKQVFLYIPGIDEVEMPASSVNVAAMFVSLQRQDFWSASATLEDAQQRAALLKREHELVVAEHRQVLELLRIELQKEEYAGKVFVIFSTHNINNVHRDFLNRLECPLIPVEMDVSTLLNLFASTLFEENELAEQKAALRAAYNKISGSCCEAVRTQLEEIDALGKKCAQLGSRFIVLKKKNDASWFEQKEYRIAREELFQLLAEIVRAGDAGVSLCDQAASAVQLPEEKEYCLACKGYCALLKKLVMRAKFMSKNFDLAYKIASKMDTQPTYRYAKKLANQIIHAADVENNGELTREIVLRFVS